MGDGRRCRDIAPSPARLMSRGHRAAPARPRPPPLPAPVPAAPPAPAAQPPPPRLPRGCPASTSGPRRPPRAGPDPSASASGSAAPAPRAGDIIPRWLMTSHHARREAFFVCARLRPRAQRACAPRWRRGPPARPRFSFGFTGSRAESAGRHLRDQPGADLHLVNQTVALGVTSSLSLNISRDGDTSASPGSPFQYLTTRGRNPSSRPARGRELEATSSGSVDWGDRPSPGSNPLSRVTG